MMSAVFRVVVVALISLLASGGIASGATAAATANAHLYAYDTPTYHAPENYTAPERGPPACGHVYTTHNAVARWADGPSVRSDERDAQPVIACTQPAPLAHVASNGDLSSPARFGVAAKTVDDGVDLYRHVSPRELTDIGENGFRLGPNSLRGKWFAESEGHARQWGAWLNPDGGSVVRVRIPRIFGDGLRREAGKYDGIGPARYVDQDQLGMLNRLMQWDVLP